MAKAIAPEAEQLMSDYFALRRGDQSKVDVLADSFTFILPFGEFHGADGLITMQEEFESAFPDGELEVQDILVDDDVAFWEWTLTGTHEGEWQGFAPTGRRVENRGISKTVISDGKIQENRAYFDMQGLIAQLADAE